MRVAGQSQPDVARQIVDDRAGPAVQPAKKFLAAEEGAVESDPGNRAPGIRADTFGEEREVRAGLVCEDRNRPHGLFDPFKRVANPPGFPYVEGYEHRGEALSAQTLRDLRPPLDEIGRASCRERVCQSV